MRLEIIFGMATIRLDPRFKCTSLVNIVNWIGTSGNWFPAILRVKLKLSNVEGKVKL